MYSDKAAQQTLDVYTSQWHEAVPFVSLQLVAGQSEFHVRVGSNGWTIILSQGGGKRSVSEPGMGAEVGVYDCEEYSFAQAAGRAILPEHLRVVESVVYLPWRILYRQKVVIQANKIGARRRAHNWFNKEGQSTIQAQVQFLSANPTGGVLGTREEALRNTAGGAT